MLGYHPISSAPISSVLRNAHLGSGKLSLGGSASCRLVLSKTASGKVSLSNSATVRPRYLYTGSGTLSLSNSATLKINRSQNATGRVVLGNSASKSIRLTTSPSGRINLSNSASKTFRLTNSPSGKVSLGGSVSTRFTVSLPTPSGTIRLNQSASIHLGFQKTTSGRLVLSNSCSATLTYFYIGSGSLTVSGDSDDEISTVSTLPKIVIENQIYTILNAAGINAEPTIRELNESELPMCVFTVDDVESIETLVGTTDECNVNVVIDVFAKDLREANCYANRIRAVLDGARNTTIKHSRWKKQSAIQQDYGHQVFQQYRVRAKIPSMACTYEGSGGIGT